MKGRRWNVITVLCFIGAGFFMFAGFGVALINATAYFVLAGALFLGGLMTMIGGTILRAMENFSGKVYVDPYEGQEDRNPKVKIEP